MKAYIVDDQPLFANGIAALITAMPGYETTDESSAELIIYGSRRGPLPATFNRPTIVITSLVEKESICQLLNQGAKGVLSREAPAVDLMAAIHMVAAGQTYIQPSLAARLLSAPITYRQPVKSVSDLTHKESIILALVRKGKSNKMIGRELNLSEKTIKHHMTSILQKTGCRNRTEAALTQH